MGLFHTLAVLLAYAVASSLAVTVHRIDLPIVNKELAPDGYWRQ